MRPAWGPFARYFSVFFDGRSLSLGGALLLSLAALGLVFAGDPSAVEAEEYSAFADPEKPALSFVLSDEQNAEEFQREFGLSDDEMERVLAAVREENEALTREYSESERIVEANEGLPKERVKDKIAASDYGEKIRAIIAETKADIRALLPEGSEAELKAWVDDQWQQESQEFQAATFQASALGITCRVYATWYVPNRRGSYEVALPHKKLKFKGGFRVRIRHGEHRAWAPVKEVGPWNTRDNYWQSRKYRDMFDDLPRCVPEAQAAYFRNYNGGRDQFGRKVLNPAGVDLTLAVARKMGIKRKLKRQGVIRVYVHYPWVRR